LCTSSSVVLSAAKDLCISRTLCEDFSLPPLVVESDERADCDGDHCIHQSVVNAAADVIAFELRNFCFRLAHSPGLSAACEHVHFRLETREFLEHFALEVIVGYAH